MSKPENWIWMPHAAHLIISAQCQYHLATYVGNGYIVSTVGEYWPDSTVRRIHAKIHDPKWYQENNIYIGDRWDALYMKRFGFEEIGFNRTYETMVFKAVKGRPGQCAACAYVIESGHNLDFDAYSDPESAFVGHMALCQKWSKK